MTVVAPRVRIMGSSDIQAALAIGGLEGWNQTEADWLRLLALAPDGCFAAEQGGRLAGTVTAVRYRPNLAWIGMMLVHPGFRGRGIAAALMRHAIGHLRGLGVEIIKLDATDAGRAVYKRLGFEDEYLSIRCSAAPGRRREVVSVRGTDHITEAFLEAVAALDRAIFGADRGELLSRLWRENAESCLCSRGEGDCVRGFIMVRRGARARYIGPWVASAPEVARSLLYRASASIDPAESVVVDITARCPEALALLEPLGFTPGRSCTRMVLGAHVDPGEPEHVYGLSGFETG